MWDMYPLLSCRIMLMIIIIASTTSFISYLSPSLTHYILIYVYISLNASICLYFVFIYTNPSMFFLWFIYFFIGEAPITGDVSSRIIPVILYKSIYRSVTCTLAYGKINYFYNSL